MAPRISTAGELRGENAERDTCAQGHPWTPETTRWRRRVRRGNTTLAPERDCLTCKHESERRRLARIASARGALAEGADTRPV